MPVASLPYLLGLQRRPKARPMHRPEDRCGPRRRARPRPGGEPKITGGHMRMRATALVGVALVLASGCGGRLGAGSVDAARAACIEAARRKGDQPIETYNVT